MNNSSVFKSGLVFPKATNFGSRRKIMQERTKTPTNQYSSYKSGRSSIGSRVAQPKNIGIPGVYTTNIMSPSLQEMMSTHFCSCMQKKVHSTLRRELEEGRGNPAAFQYTKKDLMIRMLMDQIENMHKRVGFLDRKVHS
jgi:hypothetical protein